MQKFEQLRSSGRRIPVRRLAVTALLAISLSAMAPSASAGEVSLSVAGVRANVAVQSVRERRWETVVRQQHDFSCGAAAVATLLSYHYDRPTEEVEVFDAMFAAGDQAKILRQGFSLLDMKYFLETLGFIGDGFRVTIDRLTNAGIPAIAVVTIRGYRHFVVVKGVNEEMVLVGDPAMGLKEYARDEFESLLASDIIFVVRNHVPTGRENFNVDTEWAANPPAPFGSARQPGSLASFMLSLPHPNGFGGSR